MVLHEAERGGAEGTGRGKGGAEGAGRGEGRGRRDREGGRKGQKGQGGGEERGSWGGDVGVELRSKYCRIYLNRHRC